VELTDDAEADIGAMRRWNTQPGAGPMAKKRIKTVLAAIRQLARNPCLYAKGDIPGTREMIIEDHVVVYEVDPDTGRSRTAGNVLVLRVFGPGQSRNPDQP
jgi:plasmid stabilization system protein ParE